MSHQDLNNNQNIQNNKQGREKIIMFFQKIVNVNSSFHCKPLIGFINAVELKFNYSIPYDLVTRFRLIEGIELILGEQGRRFFIQYAQGASLEAIVEDIKVVIETY